MRCSSSLFRIVLTATVLVLCGVVAFRIKREVHMALESAHHQLMYEIEQQFETEPVREGEFFVYRITGPRDYLEACKPYALDCARAWCEQRQLLLIYCDMQLAPEGNELLVVTLHVRPVGQIRPLPFQGAVAFWLYKAKILINCNIEYN